MNLISTVLLLFGSGPWGISAPIANHANLLTSVPLCSFSQTTQEKLKRASQLISAGQLEQALVLLRALMREEPQNADAQLLLGTALALVPERTAAIEALRKAIELRPEFAPAYVSLGMALARFAELDAATEVFRKALSIDPNMVEAHISYGILLAQRRQLASAREHFQQALRLLRESSAAAYPHYLLGQVLAEEEQFAGALKEIEAAIRLRPDYAEAYLSQGLIKKKLRDEDGALQAFIRAVELSPGEAKARYELGTSYLLAGQTVHAIEHLQRSLELKPGDRFSMYHLCRALRRASRHDEAKVCQQELSEIIEAQLKASDLSAGELNNEGVRLEQSGEVTAAIKKYREAINIDPRQPVFRKNLALALCRLGQWEEGAAELQEVLELDPSDTESTKALYLALESIRSTKERTKDAKAKSEKP